MNKEVEYPILAIDYGDIHYGISVSDNKGILAQPLDTISITQNRNLNDILLEILSVVKEYKVKTILVGLPQEFTEKHRRTTSKIQKFISKLIGMTEIPVVTCDESFSTTRAQNMLTSTGQNTKKSRGKINSIAATVFLQDFLNSNNNNK